MNRLPLIAIFFAAVFLLAADKKPEKTKPSAAQIQLWINQLGDKNYKIREEATGNLIKAGESAMDAVTQAANSKDTEVKQRALRIQIQLWVKQLGDANYHVREEATRNLSKAGEAAFDEVIKATKSTDAEVRYRASRIKDHLRKEVAIFYQRQGMFWAKKGKYEEAIALYTKAIEANPEHVGAYRCRGLSRLAKSKVIQGELHRVCQSSSRS